MTQINKEYGKALFLLAREKGEVERISQDLALVRDLLSSEKEYFEFLCCPAIPLSERLGAIDEAFGSDLCEFTVSFLKLLCEKGYALAFFECAEEYFALEKQWRNRVNVRVVSAVPLSDGQKKALSKKLEQTYHKQIDASYAVDPSLLGGIRVETEDTVIDASVKQQLQKLRGVISE